MMQIPGILSILTFLPLVGAVVLMLMKRPADLPEAHNGHGDHEGHGEPSPTAPEPADPARRAINTVALGVALVNFVLSIVLFLGFNSTYTNPSERNMQDVVNVPWITLGNIHIRYHMGVDGISMLLILLTTFLMVLSVLFSFNIRQRLKEFMVFLLLLETGMIGVFCALDLVLFYIFWEAMLIPMYFLIGIFGHENRVYAAIKFFLFTFAGSILMLIAIVAVYQVAGTFDVVALSQSDGPGGLLRNYNPQALMWMYAAFSLAFMIKVPMFPFHTWLPDAHVEAPTAGSVILAGVMLKMGTYGFLRFCLPLFPVEAHRSAPLFIILAIVGIIYGSIVAAVQPDAKKLVAYSSVAHLGFVVLGIYTFTPVGMMGALVQNINHGISTPMLFFVVGMLYERRHTRQISEFGGLKKIVPMMATMLLLATFASIAVPFFNGFVGEFPILLGTWTSAQAVSLGSYMPAALAATGMILSAVYMLWWYQRLMLGPVTKSANRHLPDMTAREWIVLTPLAFVIFWVGLNSNFWTERMDTAVMTLLPLSQRRLDENAPISFGLDKQWAEQDRAISGGKDKMLEQFQRMQRANPNLGNERNGMTPRRGPRRPIMGGQMPSVGGGPAPAGSGTGAPPPGAQQPGTGGQPGTGTQSPSGAEQNPAGAQPNPPGGPANGASAPNGANSGRPSGFGPPGGGRRGFGGGPGGPGGGGGFGGRPGGPRPGGGFGGPPGGRPGFPPPGGRPGGPPQGGPPAGSPQTDGGAGSQQPGAGAPGNGGTR